MNSLYGTMSNADLRLFKQMYRTRDFACQVLYKINNDVQ